MNGDRQGGQPGDAVILAGGGDGNAHGDYGVCSSVFRYRPNGAVADSFKALKN
jgi:hypothetical protein